MAEFGLETPPRERDVNDFLERFDPMEWDNNHLGYMLSVTRQEEALIIAGLCCLREHYYPQENLE